MDRFLEIFLTLFFGAFALLGGGMLGVGLRARIEKSNGARGWLSNGAVFGGVPLWVAALFLLPLNAWLYAGIVIVFFAALILSAFLPRGYVEELGAGTLIALGFGGIAAGIGILVGIEAMRRQDLFFGLIFSGCFVFIGGGFFLNGLYALWRGKPLVMRMRRPGEYELTPEDERAQDAETRPTRKK